MKTRKQIDIQGYQPPKQRARQPAPQHPTQKKKGFLVNLSISAMSNKRFRYTERG